MFSVKTDNMFVTAGDVDENIKFISKKLREIVSMSHDLSEFYPHAKKFKITRKVFIQI